jgi:hypothetical protein
MPEAAAAAKEAVLQEQYGDDPAAAALASTQSSSGASSSGGHGKASKAGSAPPLDPHLYHSKLSEAVGGLVGGALGGFEGEVERRKVAVAEVLEIRAAAAAQRFEQLNQEVQLRGQKGADGGGEAQGHMGQQQSSKAVGEGTLVRDEALESLAWQHFDKVRQVQLLEVAVPSTF